jgi:hypothetical protein
MTTDRRNPALLQLTPEHHRALAEARRLRLAADGDEEQRRSAVNAFIRFFENDAIAHFRAEERILLPRLTTKPEVTTRVMRLMREHIQIDSCVRKLRHSEAGRAPTTETMNSIAGMVEANIRFEEGVVFPMVGGVAIDNRVHRASALCGSCERVHTDRDVDGELFGTCIPCQAELVEVALRLLDEQ